MRRRIRKNFLFLNILFLFLLLLTIIGVSYSYLSSSLNIEGSVKGKLVDGGYTITPDSNPNLNANVNLTSTWIENGITRSQYILNITNVGTTVLDNFKITVAFRSVVETPMVWDYGYNLNGKSLTITNTQYSLNPGQTLSISFAVSSKSPPISILSLKLESTGGAIEVALNKFNVNFVSTSSWGNYTYQYNVTVTNKTGGKITYWQVNVELPVGTSYVSGWSAIFTTQNNLLIIKNETYNGKLNNNGSTTFGLQLSTNVVNFIPTNIRVFVR